MIFHIVYPRGDRKYLAVAKTSDGCRYELSDYDRASRKEFDSYDEALEHAEKLAEEHGLTLEQDGHAYLD